MNTDVEMPLSDTNYHGRGKDQVTEKDDIFLKNSLTLRLQAYGVVLGAFLANFISVGVVNTFGIIIRASEHDPTSHFRNIGSFRLGFVTGIAAGFTFLVGPFSNILTSRLGIRFPIGLGVLLMTIALELASLTKDYWQLFLSQGVLWGLGSSLCFIPAIGLPSQWFIKNRGIATGVASSGAPVGAMILSSVIQRIINGSSLQWALRALGFIILGLGIVATVLLRPKPKLEKDSVVTQYRFMDFSVIKTRGYPVYMTFAFLQMFGYTTPVFWLPNYALSIGLTSSQGSNIIVILNAGNFVGRLTAGQLGDKLGTLNILTLFTFMAGLVCVVGWIFAHSFASLAGFSVCWGFFAGAYWSLTVPATGRIVSAEKLGSAVAINFLMNVIPPIFSASIGARLNTATAHLLGIGDSTPKAFRYLIVWSGMTYMVSALLIAFVRFMLEKRILVRI